MNMKNLQYYRFKSHDCHMFMERLIPLSFHDILPNPVWDALIEISNFFRDILSIILQVNHVETFEKNIVETLCKLKKIFSTEFFDSMEHLTTHLAYETKVGRPVQYPWMYPFKP